MATTPPPAARLLCERRGRVLLLTISNPAARNALAMEISTAADAAMREAASDAGIGAVVLTGEGEHFCGGGNLNRLLAQRDKPPADQVKSLDLLHRWVTAIRECPRPVIVAVEGAAAGAGFSIALNCDLIVAADDAKFVMSYVKIGLTPDGGGTAALATMLPAQTALEFLLEGGVVGAQRLHQLGVVNKVTPKGQALTEALALAERLARGPANAQARIKRLVHTARTRTHRDQLDAERDTFIESLYGDEAGEGINAFLGKRAPKFVE